MDRCDALDLLEEAALTHAAVEIRLRDGRAIEKEVRAIVTEDGEDYALLVDAERVAVSDIVSCQRCEPRTTTYDPKL